MGTPPLRKEINRPATAKKRLNAKVADGRNKSENRSMTARTEKYYLFIDESGDHGLTTLSPDFPIFLLCGVLISKPDYFALRDEFNAIKKHFWKNKVVIFHSRNIRKCEKEFQILFDMELKAAFYKQLNASIQNGKYTVIASAIRKDRYIKKYGRLSKDVYELALSLMIERSVFCLGDIKVTNKSLRVIIEKRGKKEDKKLHEHFQRLLARGTGYVEPQRLGDIDLGMHFKNKKENINGLQLADLVAYPTAKYVMDPKRANLAFGIVAPKIYSKKGKRYGLKIFP